MRRKSGICWSNNIAPLQLVKAIEDRELRKHVIADVVFDDTVQLV